MIPIKFKGEEKKTINKLYHALLDKDTHQGLKNYIKNLKDVNTWCINNIVIDGHSLSFPDIIQADFIQLEKIVSLLDSGRVTRFPYEKFIIDTLYTYRFPRKEFVDSLGTTVCPYCNRNFVNSIKSRTMCDLDHFYDKDSYPILAVSFYNLVPVCHTCNHVKKNQRIQYSPHDTRYISNNIIHFDYYISGMDYLFDKSDIGIEIEALDPVIEGSINNLKLLELYQIHTDIVQEILKKAMIFSPEYIDDIYSAYDGLFESKNEIYKLILGECVEDDYGKRPLEKMKRDIIQELYETIYGI